MTTISEKNFKHGQQPVAYVQSVNGDAASKTSLYSGKEGSDDGKDMPDELDTASVWLDNIKDDNHGSKIIRRGTDDVLYTFARAHRWTRPTIDIFHGEASQDKEERDDDCIPFASIKSGCSGQIRLRYQPDDGTEPVDLKRKEFLKARKWWGMPQYFECDGVAYRIRMPSAWSCKSMLTVANDDAKTPLCVMRPSKNPFGPIRPSIEILPAAVATTDSPKEHALLLNDQPTKLLDLAIAADHIYRLYLNQIAATSSASSAASSSAAAAAAA